MAPTDDDRVHILVMDANERNAELLGEFIAGEGYEPVVCTEIETADEVVADPSQFGFAVIDVDRFDTPVWSYCKRLDEHDVPFIVLSGLQNPTLRHKSHGHGANAFVDKPIPKQQFRTLIETAISP